MTSKMCCAAPTASISFFFFKSTIYYMGRDGSLCLQEELCMEYQYPNLFMQLPNTKDY